MQCQCFQNCSGDKAENKTQKHGRERKQNNFRPKISKDKNVSLVTVSIGYKV